MTNDDRGCCAELRDWQGAESIGKIARSLLLCRVVVGVSFVVSILLLQKQTIDVIRAIIPPLELGWALFGYVFHFAFAGVFVLGAIPFTIWFCGRWLDRMSRRDPVKQVEYSACGKRIFPRLAAIAPLFAMALGLWLGQNPDDGREFWVLIIGCLLMVPVWWIFFEKRSKADDAIVERMVRAGIDKIGWVVVGLIVILALVWISPVKFPQFLGTLPAVLLFFCAFSVLATILSWAYEAKGLPLLSALFIWTAFLSFFNWTDNHEIATVPVESIAPGEEKLQPQRLLEDDFFAWLRARKADWDQEDKDKKYPVFIVAAEGGGIYAAQNAAFALGRLDDLSIRAGADKPFSNNIYSISGISGGSVGAALFVSHLAETQKGVRAATKNKESGDAKPASIEGDLAKVLQADLLSPIAANMFSLDYVQRFLPFDIGMPDRGEAFEKAVQSAWVSGGGQAETLMQPVSSLRQTVPALLLNATELKSGRTVASARFRFTRDAVEKIQKAMRRTNLKTGAEHRFEQNGERLTFREILGPVKSETALYYPVKECQGSAKKPLKKKFVEETFAKERELSVLTAAATSARFPYVAPAGYLIRRDTQKCGEDEYNIAYRSQYVDGGYVEASGVEPALVMVRRLHEAIEEVSDEGDFWGLDTKIELHLVTIELGAPRTYEDSNRGEILAPPAGLLAVWSTRARVARERAIDYFKSLSRDTDPASEPKGPQMYRIQPFDANGSIPLGWRLSEATSLKLRKLLCATEEDPLQSDEVKPPQSDEVKPPLKVMKDLIEKVAHLSRDKEASISRALKEVDQSKCFAEYASIR